MTDFPRFSRHAIDSTGVPMDDVFTLRIPHELRILAGRKARVMGLSLGEYIRHLVARSVDEDILKEDVEALVMRKGAE